MLLVDAQKDHLPKKIIIMFMMLIRIIIYKWLSYAKFFIRRKIVVLVPLLVLSVVSVLLLWPMCTWLVKDTRPFHPALLDQTQHVRMNRNLQHYLKNIQVLIEPSASSCAILGVPVVIMVSSAPSNVDRRVGVRETWAKYQPTFFVLGLSGDGDTQAEQLRQNQEEAKRFGDLIVFDFRDHHQNLTLKTALMMKWSLNRCPQARFMFKTVDDVLVNPWTLDKVLWENMSAQLIGYRMNQTKLNNVGFNKGYIQQVLHDNKVSTYLSGTGYLIKREYIKRILKKAYKVPIVYLEDVYFTFLVAHKELGLSLRHDKRLSPYKPWLKIDCVYWDLATVHSLGPQEMLTAWRKIVNLVISYDSLMSVCAYYNSYFNILNDFVLH